MPNTYTGFGWKEDKMNENPSNEFFFAYMEALKNESICWVTQVWRFGEKYTYTTMVQSRYELWTMNHVTWEIMTYEPMKHEL
jgi:hypothetical protein